jgi:Outer membrane protein beta-barrel domain
MRYRSLWLLILAAIPCWGQSWNLGVAGGFGWYHDASIKNAGESASAGFGPRVSASAVLGEDTFNYLGGELRYTFRDGDSELKSAGTEANMDAASHAVHYDFLFYGTPRGSRLRPYAAGGAGIKYYTATGHEDPAQPLSSFAFLTHVNEVEPLISFGAGVKWQFAEHWQMRLDFRDYATPFPEKLFAPAPGSKIHGWLHDFVPLLGVDWTFGGR